MSRAKRLLAALLIATGLTAAVPARAFDQGDLDHLAMHSGTSFGIQTILYGVNSQHTPMGKPMAMVLSTIETLMIGLLYKAVEGAPALDTLRATGENALGCAGAIASEIVFHF